MQRIQQNPNNIPPRIDQCSPNGILNSNHDNGPLIEVNNIFTQQGIQHACVHFDIVMRLSMIL